MSPFNMFFDVSCTQMKLDDGVWNDGSRGLYLPERRVRASSAVIRGRSVFDFVNDPIECGETRSIEGNNTATEKKRQSTNHAADRCLSSAHSRDLILKGTTAAKTVDPVLEYILWVG